MQLSEFQSLPIKEVEKIIQETGPHTCAWVVNGTRRWYMLEYQTRLEDFSLDYLGTINQRTIEIIQMFFEHGVNTLVMPIISPYILRKRSASYGKMASYAIEQLTVNQHYLDFYDSLDVRVGVYGDYKNYFGKETVDRLEKSIESVKQRTADHRKKRIFWGVCAHDAIETVSQLSIDHYLKNSVAPTKKQLIEAYYGEYVEPVDLYLSASKPRVFDVPLISSGRESLYFTVAPSPYMDQSQFRDILYDHIFHRTATQSQYTFEDVDQEKDWNLLRDFYHLNKRSTLGIGIREERLGVWHAVPQVQTEEEVCSVQQQSTRNNQGDRAGHHNFLLADQILDTLKETGPGHNTTTAYDTAWVAKLKDQAPKSAAKALNWLRKNQLSNGSWGMNRPLYHHDRVVCTLAAIIALRKNGDIRDRDRVAKGLFALHDHLELLHMDQAGPTVGFEMILPALINEALDVGLLPPIDDEFLTPLRKVRSYKLSLSPNGMINRDVSMAFSAEMAGEDGKKILAVDDILEANGSVALSPSATAYYLLKIKPFDPEPLAYIQSLWQNGIANFSPFDLFEQGWVLWNFSLNNLEAYPEIEARKDEILENLYQNWRKGEGIGFSEFYSPTDADDTAITFRLLNEAGYDVDISDVLRFEGDNHFRTFDFETHSSVSTNVHILFALRAAGYDRSDPEVQKILKFIEAERVDRNYWIDKWHISPYYVTSHAIIALIGLENELARDSIQWMLDTQKSNGGWGDQFTTAEETAYCLQAILLWKKAGHYVPEEAIKNALEWLNDHLFEPYPPQWMAKCLYSPLVMVRSSILSALMLAKEIGLADQRFAAMVV
ncbi:MAG: hypothetical protein AAF902_08450 [Chloroflexota bacterium]